jgi:hypothetical protein
MDLLLKSIPMITARVKAAIDSVASQSAVSEMYVLVAKILEEFKAMAPEMEACLSQ